MSSHGPWEHLGGRTGATEGLADIVALATRGSACTLEGRVSTSQAPDVLLRDLSQWPPAKWQLMSCDDFLCCLVSPAASLAHGTSCTSVGSPCVCGLHTSSSPISAPPGPGSEDSCLPSGRPGHPGEIAPPGRCRACACVTAQQEARVGAVGAEKTGEEGRGGRGGEGRGGVRRAVGEGPRAVSRGRTPIRLCLCGSPA